MKKYLLALHIKAIDGYMDLTKYHQFIEGDTLVEICAKFPLMIAQIMQDDLDEIRQEILNNQEDDIPF